MVAVFRLVTFVQGLSKRKARGKAVTKGKLDEEDNIYSPRNLSSVPRTSQNALRFALETLNSACQNLPIGSIITAAINPLLIITDRIEQVSSNEQGLTELAARIRLLTPIVSGIAEGKTEQGRIVLDALKRELESITKDLNHARSQGNLNKFFNSTDNASSLSKHNTVLTQMIADSTLMSVQEVLKSLHDLQLSNSLCEGQFETGDITGGIGGPGGSGRIGGQGGDGEGPKVEISSDKRWKIGNISGGTGGTGGAGIDVGGKGGTGKAPVITTFRRNTVLVA